MNFPYIESVDDFRRRIKEAERDSEAERRVRQYLLKEWGIDVDNLPLPEVDEPTVGPARQLPAENIEMRILRTLAEEYGINFLPLTFKIDTYTSNNPLKSSYVNRKLVEENGKNGGWRIRKERIARPLEKQVLCRIETVHGVPLDEYYEKRWSAYGRGHFDFGSTFSSALAQNLNNGRENIIENVWIEVNGKGQAEKFTYDPEKKAYVCAKAGMELSIDEVAKLAEQRKARPDASWYYQKLYLLIPGILCPQSLLMVTPWEQDDGKIQGMAHEAYEEIKGVAGVYPATARFYDVNNDERYIKTLGKYPAYRQPEPELWIEGDNLKMEGNFYKDAKTIAGKFLKEVLER